MGHITCGRQMESTFNPPYSAFPTYVQTLRNDLPMSRSWNEASTHEDIWKHLKPMRHSTNLKFKAVHHIPPWARARCVRGRVRRFKACEGVDGCIFRRIVPARKSRLCFLPSSASVTAAAASIYGRVITRMATEVQGRQG